LEENNPPQLVSKSRLIFKFSYRFLDPITNGQYAYLMQEIVEHRLPLFSDEESTGW
jgi:hypothetical protein